MLIDSSIPTIIALTISAIFAVSAALHLTAPGFLRRAYERWNFPPDSYRVTGVMELIAAVFLANPLTRIWGIGLAAFVIFTTIAMLLNNRQYALTVPGILLLVALVPASLAATI
jgi:DoxX-like family